MADTELFDLLGKYTGLFVLLFVIPALGAYLGSYLKKKGENLATHEDIDMVLRQVTAVTDATKRIEARTTRALRVHERQLDILAKLYRHFFEAQGWFQRATSAARFANELEPKEQASLVTKAMTAAYEELLNGRLFIPEALVKLIANFFTAVSQGQLQFEVWSNYPVGPSFGSYAGETARQRADFWEGAAKVAHEQLPEILRQIEKAARNIIGDETTTSPT